MNRQLLIKALAEHGIKLSDDKIDKFSIHSEFMQDHGKNVNLTAITDNDEIAVKHFADSVIPMELADIKSGATFADVGTGAGFPGVPLSIIRDDIEINLIDSLNKRLIFLDKLKEKVGTRYTTFHMRAEDAGRDPDHREYYDVVTARAVANLSSLCEYCLPLVKVGGVFLALKAGGCDKEVEMASNAIMVLGGEIIEKKEYNLIDQSKRVMIIIKKISQCSTKYPRKGIKISKKPL